jgi:hypothetical protein
MRTPLVTATASLALVVALAGCGSEAQNLADGGLKTAACTAISNIEGKLADAENASPDELDSLKTQAQAAEKAIEAAGDNVPESVQTKVSDATTKLEDAADAARTDAAAAKDKVKSAAADLTNALDEAATKLSC